MNNRIDWLAGNCKRYLLEEKWLLADNLPIAQQWKDKLNLAGHSSVNLHSKTLRSLAITLAGEKLASQNLSFVNLATVRMLVHSIVSHMRETNQLEYFHSVISSDGLSDLLAKSIQDLRMAGLEPHDIREIAFESAAKARDLVRIYQTTCERLLTSNTADYARCVELATTGILDGSIVLPRGLLVLVPTELKKPAKAEQRLFDAVAQKASVLKPDGEVLSVEASRCLITDRLSTGEAKFDFLAGLGEVNEVRGVVQRIMASENGRSQQFDNVELLYTDYQQYVPLILELFSTWLASNGTEESKLPSVDSLPLTFAEGIACIYSRPGRALRSWLRWVGADFVQTKAVQLLREGLLIRPANAEDIGYSRLANTLRRVPIGFHSERYVAKLNEAIDKAKQLRQEYETRSDKESDLGPPIDSEPRDFGLPALHAVLAIMKPLINLAPRVGNDAISILGKARGFLLQCVRSENKLDRYARAKLLDDIDGMITTLQSANDSTFDVLQWLEDLPMQSFILDSGPLPGCIHIAPIDQGGHSGRKFIYVVGLDDARYPRPCSIDPILLDAERGRLSKDLENTEDRSRYQQQSLDRMLYRILEGGNAHVSFSYSVRSLADDRECFPSSTMLEMFRLSNGQSGDNMDDLVAMLGRPVSFVSESSDEHLSVSDMAIADILLEKDEKFRLKKLEEQFEHTAHSRIARESQWALQIGHYDGLVPRAGTDLNPASGEPISPSRLETYGACPRRFFFQRGLGIYPPDEWNVDSENWLDSIQFGNLVHGLFEDFLREHTASGLIPNLARDRDRLIQLLETKIESLQLDIPIPNAEAFLRQREQLEEICEIFLKKEEEYCREHHARPWILESSFGLSGESKTELDCDEPVSVTLSDGRMLRVSGRIDRVDKLMTGGSERYVIWDYKSGSSFGFKQEDPFDQGRKLQSFLYVGMLRHRIAATGGNADGVDSFGYFFPNPNSEGLRLRWTRGELRGGDEIMRHICDSIAAGVFVATTNKEDCRFCDYVAVCGDVESVTCESFRKAAHPINQVLVPIRLLRGIPESTEEAE